MGVFCRRFGKSATSHYCGPYCCYYTALIFYKQLWWLDNSTTFLFITFIHGSFTERSSNAFWHRHSYTHTNPKADQYNHSVICLPLRSYTGSAEGFMDLLKGNSLVIMKDVQALLFHFLCCLSSMKSLRSQACFSQFSTINTCVYCCRLLY